jgi:hypothetical protein
MMFVGDPKEVWTDEDAERAEKEGWQLAASITEGVLIICPAGRGVVLEDDDKETTSSANYVINKAMDGSSFHMRACWLAGQPKTLGEYAIPSLIAPHEPE